MFGSNRAKLNKIDRLEKRSVELARQVRDLSEENNYLHKENKDLRYENEEQEDILKEINSLTTSNTYNNEKIILNKIKELVHDYQSGN